MIILENILQFLVGSSNVPSNFGAVLERRQDDVIPTGDAQRVKDAIELSMLRDIAVIRCIDGLKEAKDFKNTGAIRTLSRNCGFRYTEGALAVGVLTKYHHWEGYSPERALVEVYNWVRSLAPDKYKPILHDESSAHMAFAAGKAKKPRQIAADLYADALVIAADWVEKWNEDGSRSKRSRKRTGSRKEPSDAGAKSNVSPLKNAEED